MCSESWFHILNCNKDWRVVGVGMGIGLNYIQVIFTSPGLYFPLILLIPFLSFSFSFSLPSFLPSLHPPSFPPSFLPFFLSFFLSCLLVYQARLAISSNLAWYVFYLVLTPCQLILASWNINATVAEQLDLPMPAGPTVLGRHIVGGPYPGAGVDWKH